jgi:delta(3,5)-delta(2,4)-dienoyl-CoA isomerase
MPQDYSGFEYFNITFPSEYVAQVEIDRPKKLNAFTEPMFHSIGAIFDRLSHDQDVRAVIISGNGDRAFSAGLDVQAASEGGVVMSDPGGDVARKATRLRRHIQEIQDCVTAVEKCEKPVIIVMHGISYGLAIDLSSCCDVRICAKDTRFSVREVEIGLAADVGTLSRLPKLGVSMSFVKDVALTARDFSAQEALQVGFVSAVCETKKAALDRALDLGKLIATKSPVAVQSTKEVMNYSRDHTVADGTLSIHFYSILGTNLVVGLNYVKVWNASMVQTKDVEDAMLSGLKKRKPTFAKL